MTNLSVIKGEVAFRIADSMLPQFCVGDIVVIDPNTTPTSGDFVVATVKCSNPAIMQYRGCCAHIKIIGTMVEHRRRRMT